MRSEAAPPAPSPSPLLLVGFGLTLMHGCGAAGLRQDGPPIANGGPVPPAPAPVARTASNISFPDGETPMPGRNTCALAMQPFCSWQLRLFISCGEVCATYACCRRQVDTLCGMVYVLHPALPSAESVEEMAILTGSWGNTSSRCCECCAGVLQAPPPRDLIFGSMPPHVMARLRTLCRCNPARRLPLPVCDRNSRPQS